MRTARLYYEQVQLWGQRGTSPLELRRVRDTISMVPEDVISILDVGCGDGSVANMLRERKYEVIGLDLSLEALRHVEVTATRGSCESLPFDTGSFDLVLAAELLEHLTEGVYLAALTELQRVSREYILISVPFDEFLPRRYVKCQRCGTIFHAYHHLRSFSLEKIQDLFGGFQLKQVCYSGDMVKPDNRVLLAIRQSLGDRWFSYQKARPWCPMCGNTEFPRAGTSTLARACMVLNRLLPKRKKPHWVIALFEAEVE